MSKSPAAAKRGIPSKNNFKEWYPFIVEAAELVDKRYPIKGMDVWRPYGWKTMRLIDNLTHDEMERTDHEEVNFPLLIPEDLLDKENRLVSLLKKAREEGVDPSELRMEDDIGGFAKEVYWIRHAGETKLDKAMFLRPTSETAMYTMFPLWIRSHADLPLKTYQIVNTFRYETKQTRSFIRVREIHFFEAHTAHIDEEDATKQINEDLKIVKNLMDKLNLPVLVTKRPVWDTFPGAWYTIAIDVIMPDGRTLQVASVHHYRDQWARAFDIKYENDLGEQEYVHQTTYGMSERLLGAIVATHGDDKGLIMPPSVAPVQVVVIPILSKDNSEEIMAAASKMVNDLKSEKIRAKLDDRDIRPGQKYYDWEIKGVPIRIELGPRDLKSNSFMCAKRTGEKSSHSLDNLLEAVRKELDSVSKNMKEHAGNHFNQHVKKMPNLRIDGSNISIEEKLEDEYVYEMAFEGNDAEAEMIEKETGFSLLGESMNPYAEKRKCIVSGKSTTKRIFLAKSY
jgi:prolyl-tRNA synthetase